MKSTSAALQSVWQPDRLMPLGPGKPDETKRSTLGELSAESLFAPAKIKHDAFASGCLAGLWLWYDFLDESHQISQDVASPEGSYWHGIMHRREPDYWNSKYWFRRVGDHPIFEPLAASARELAREAPPEARRLADQRRWDPFAFVDLCERAAAAGGALELSCRRLQKAEWELLFEHCWQRAIASA